MKIASPDWWPTESDYALVEAVNDRFTLWWWSKDERKFLLHSEPAYVRLTRTGQLSHWGSRAQDWLSRSARPRPLAIFHEERPVDAALAGQFLRLFHQKYLSNVKTCRLYLPASEAGSWVGDLWNEALEDSPFSSLGTLNSSQRELVKACGGLTARCRDLHLLLDLQPTRTQWTLLKDASTVAAGTDLRLSHAQVARQITDHVRTQCLVDLSSRSLEELLEASKSLEEDRRSSPLEITVAGRHMLSGLPTRCRFSWKQFLFTDPPFLHEWRRIRQGWSDLIPDWPQPESPEFENSVLGLSGCTLIPRGALAVLLTRDWMNRAAV